MKIGELLIELGFKAETTKLNDFVRSVGELNMSSIMAGVGVAGLYEGIKKILTQASETAMEMHMFGVETGLSEQKMKSWSNLAEQAGVKAGVLQQTLEHMQMAQAKAKIGQADQSFLMGLSMLNKYGHAQINLYEDVFKQQDKIRNGLAALDDGQKRNVLSLLGINEQMLLFYKLSDDVYNKRNDQAVATSAEVEKLTEFWRTTKEAGQQISRLFMEIGAGLATWATPIIEFVGGMAEAVSKSRALQGVLLSIALAISLLTGNVPAAIASLAGLGTWAFSNKEKIGELLGQMGKPNDNPLGLPPGVKMGLPAGVAYTGPQTQTVSVTNHITGDNPHEIGQKVKQAMQEALNEAHYQAPPRQF